MGRDYRAASQRHKGLTRSANDGVKQRLSATLGLARAARGPSARNCADDETSGSCGTRKHCRVEIPHRIVYWTREASSPWMRRRGLDAALVPIEVLFCDCQRQTGKGVISSWLTTMAVVPRWRSRILYLAVEGGRGSADLKLVCAVNAYTNYRRSAETHDGQCSRTILKLRALASAPAGPDDNARWPP